MSELITIFISLLAGSLLAVVGGLIGNEIEARRAEQRELSSIKISLSDELEGIKTTINNMHEVWKKTDVLSSSYITDLLSSTGTFDSLHLRLFLIKDQNLRKKIIVFYKNLKDTAEASKGKVGTLDETEKAKKAQASIEEAFQKIGTEAGEIKAELGA